MMDASLLIIQTGCDIRVLVLPVCSLMFEGNRVALWGAVSGEMEWRAGGHLPQCCVTWYKH